MPSTYTDEIPIELQAAGENVNVWGDPKLNNALKRLTKSIAGTQTIALTADITLTSSNSSTDAAQYQASHSSLKFTGTGAYTVTIPARAKIFLIRNSCTGDVTITTGAGTTAVVEPGEVAFVHCDGSAVLPIGVDGVSLKAYVDQQAFAALSGDLPGQAGNADKFLGTNGTVAAWRAITNALITDYPGLASSAEVIAGTDAAKYVVASALAGAITPQTLTDAATIEWDMALGFNAKVTLAGNRTLGDPSNAAEFMSGALRIIQDGTGSRTLAYDSCWDFGAVGAPTLSTAAASDDIISYIVVTTSPLKIKATFMADS